MIILAPNLNLKLTALLAEQEYFQLVVLLFFILIFLFLFEIVLTLLSTT